MRWPEAFSPRFAKTDHEQTNAHNIAFIGEDLILTDQHELPSTEALHALGTPKSDFIIGDLDGTPCRALLLAKETALPEGLQLGNLRFLHGLIPDGYWAMAARAKQMISWDQSSRFCGACGTPTAPADNEPSKVCPSCGQRDFPRISPAVIVIVRRGDKILLARSPHFRPGMYGALAGFMEAGESVEECLRREVYEEVGITIKNLRWFDSQTWPFPNSLMLAFHADYESGEITPQPGEIEDAAWFDLDEMPTLPYPVSIAYRLIVSAAEAIRRNDTPSI